MMDKPKNLYLVESVGGRELPVAFVPHWKTCPNAGDFRRNGRG